MKLLTKTDLGHPSHCPPVLRGLLIDRGDHREVGYKNRRLNGAGVRGVKVVPAPANGVTGTFARCEPCRVTELRTCPGTSSTCRPCSTVGRGSGHRGKDESGPLVHLPVTTHSRLWVLRLTVRGRVVPPLHPGRGRVRQPTGGCGEIE